MLLRRLPKVALASLLALVTDVSVLLLARHLGAPIWLASLLGCGAGGATNFAMNRAHVFAGAAGEDVGVAALRYAVLVVAGGALLTALLMQAGRALGLPLLATRALVALLVVLVWNYPVTSRLVFPEERHVES